MTFETIDAETFLAQWAHSWKQGEHVALIGPTGSGKTAWLEHLMTPRGWVVLMASKPKDATAKGLLRRGWTLVRRWPPPNDLARRVVFWPKITGLHHMKAQRDTFADMLAQVFETGSWTVVADDLQYLCKNLGLTPLFSAYWLQARSLKVSLVASTQRPRWVPVECWANSSHFFLWGTANGDDLKQIGNIAGADQKTIREAVVDLPKWHVLYVPAREKDSQPIIVNLKGINR